MWEEDEMLCRLLENYMNNEMAMHRQCTRFAAVWFKLTVTVTVLLFNRKVTLTDYN